MADSDDYIELQILNIYKTEVEFLITGVGMMNPGTLSLLEWDNSDETTTISCSNKPVSYIQNVQTGSSYTFTGLTPNKAYTFCYEKSIGTADYYKILTFTTPSSVVEVKGKYLKDEDGNLFSPITSFSTVVNEDSVSLADKLNEDAYFIGTLAFEGASSGVVEQAIDANTLTRILWKCYLDNPKNISLYNSTSGYILFSVGGTYIIQQNLRIIMDSSSATPRIFTQISYISSTSNTFFKTIRGGDLQKCFVGDTVKQDTWVVNVEAGDILSFYVYSTSSCSVQAWYESIASYITIKRIGDPMFTD